MAEYSPEAVLLAQVKLLDRLIYMLLIRQALGSDDLEILKQETLRSIEGTTIPFKEEAANFIRETINNWDMAKK